MNALLVVNSGSSSVKFQVFRADRGRGLERVIKGQMSGIGVQPRLRAEDVEGRVLLDRTFENAEISEVGAALEIVSRWLRDQYSSSPVAIGHRVVHGGADYSAPVVVDREVLARLEKLSSLAPLHQPSNLAPIRRILERSPNLPQVACFDTAFHRAHDALADHYAIPEQLYQDGVRRYGFHGLSYEYIASRLPEVAPDIAAGRVIVAHLGSGASMCALFKGRSVDSTMGFTALDGIPMGTRPGQIDAGVVLYLIAEKGMSAGEVQQLLYYECGLKGLSGLSNDVRDLEASADPRAEFALEYFAHRVGVNAGMLAASLGGFDAFIFTAGIGEKSANVRERIVKRLAWLGADIDANANARHARLISSPNSRIPLYVLPTDEETMIARHTLAKLADHRQSAH
jgi:acetate kinase